MRKAFDPTVVCVRMDNRYERDRILRTQSRLVLAAEWKCETALDRCADSKRPSTAGVTGA